MTTRADFTASQAAHRARAQEIQGLREDAAAGQVSAQYLVPETNLEPLRIKVAELNKKAVKLAQPAVTALEAFDHDELVELDRELALYRTRRWFLVTVTGVSPKLNGWRFVATLTPTGEGMIVSGVPGEAIPTSFRTTDCHCDQCHTVRARKVVHLVRHDDGRFAQVGADCLKDFLGHADPHDVARYAELLGAFDVWASDSEYAEDHGARLEPTFDLETVLALSSLVSRCVGWLGRGKARELDDAGIPHRPPTANTIGDLLSGSTAGEDFRRAFKAEHGWIADVDTQLATAAAAWAEALEGELTDYEHNLHLIARARVVTFKTLGLAASMTIAYQRAKDLLAERQGKQNEAALSVFYGQPKDKIDLVLTIGRRGILIASDWGTSELLRFTDSAHHHFTWFATAAVSQDIREGDEVRVRGTIKRHEDYKGYKITQLTRCTVMAELDYQAFLVKQAEEKAAKKAAQQAARAAKRAAAKEAK